MINPAKQGHVYPRPTGRPNCSRPGSSLWIKATAAIYVCAHSHTPLRLPKGKCSTCKPGVLMASLALVEKEGCDGGWEGSPEKDILDSLGATLHPVNLFTLCHDGIVDGVHSRLTDLPLSSGHTWNPGHGVRGQFQSLGEPCISSKHPLPSAWKTLARVSLTSLHAHGRPKAVTLPVICLQRPPRQCSRPHISVVQTVKERKKGLV